MLSKAHLSSHLLLLLLLVPFLLEIMRDLLYSGGVPCGVRAFPAAIIKEILRDPFLQPQLALWRS